MRHSYNMLAFPAVALLLSMCSVPYEPPPPQLTAGALSDAYGTATAEAKVVRAQPTEARTLTPTSSATPTPCCGVGPITVTPRPSTTPVNGVVEINGQELEWLGATCWIEARGMGDKRFDACASVVSTIMLRTRERLDSDGTLFGTLTYQCKPDSEFCAFPAWAVYGCEGIVPQVCPFYDTQGMIDFTAMANTYLEGDYPAPCADRLYYGSRPGIDDRAEACVIEADNGQWIGWYN